MTCKFVLKFIIREKWLVDNELKKGVAQTSIKICFVCFFAHQLLCISYFDFVMNVTVWMVSQTCLWCCHKLKNTGKKITAKLQFIWENESN